MKSVLLVDPDTSFLHRAGLALTVVGFNAHVTASTDEALEMLGVRRYDLIVAAEEMPELTGSAFLAEAARLSSDARRVLTRQTASAAPPDTTLTRDVQKPLSAEALAALVVEILGASTPAAKPDAAVGVRRTRLLQSLEEAYPGLLDVAEGAHLPQPSAELAALRRMTAATLSGDTNTAERFGFGRYLESVAPQPLADDILVVAVQTPETTITVEPGAYQHTIHFETTTQSVPLVTLPSALGDSLAARIALLAQLDLAVPGHQMGQIVVDYDGIERTVVVALRTSGFGLGVELRCDDVIEEPAPITLTTRKPIPSPQEADAAPPEELVPGYRLLEPLGEGGIGIVYRAVHLVLETEVAIKLMLPGEAAQQNSALRMMREARAASRSRHPSIVSVLDCGRLPDQRAYIIMELVAAPTLDKILEKNGALPIAEAVRIIKRVAEALENAHSVGVIHRDIKPSNIFVSEETGDPATSIVKLSDFGAAQLDDASPGATGEHLTVGTPHYMAPEQARSSRVDRRSDIYSLGCVLFEMLSGKPPYAGKTALDVIAQHVLSPVPAVTSPLGPLPLAVTRALRRALAKNPDERHQNARELINDLEGATASIERTGWRRWLP